MDLKNKIVIVTGGTKGIGKAFTEKLIEFGAIVIATFYNDLEAAKKLEYSIKKKYKNSIEVLRSSVVDSKSTKLVIEHVKQKYKKIDVLINNAGVLHNGLFAMMKSTSCDELIDINFKGTINTTLCVLRTMIAQKKGVIINISSISSLIPSEGISIYSATKAAINTFTSCLALELESYNIMVYGIAIGMVNTDMLLKLTDDYKMNFSKKHGIQIREPKEIVSKIMKTIINKEAQSGETLLVT